MTKIPMKIVRVYYQIKVDDLERSTNFYKDVFGFEITLYVGPELGWAESTLPGGLRLGHNLRLPGQDHPPSWGVLTLEVEDLKIAWDYLKKKGLDVTEIIETPNIKFFNTKDSEGNSIQIVQVPKQK
ncbi:MAG: VOC family protein [Candidatus Heimdallarchaeota archaeon]|nr:VOC family protein [Candidatus Heimdallarchaeota archaeon]MBY8994854.1 VOC family protein [Candidatus Heimdallarchaeota archaeon]